MYNCILENVYNAPFLSVGHALGFWNRNNPARMKSINLLEPEGRSTSPGEHCHDDLWASILGAMQHVLKTHDSFSAVAFKLRNIGDREGHWSVQDIARFLHVSPRRLYRALDKIYDELETEMIRRGLLDPAEDSKG